MLPRVTYDIWYNVCIPSMIKYPLKGANSRSQEVQMYRPSIVCSGEFTIYVKSHWSIL